MMKKLLALLLSLMMFVAIAPLALADEAPVMSFAVALDAIPEGYAMEQQAEGDVVYLVFTPEDAALPTYYVSVAFSELFDNADGPYTLNNAALTEEDKANVEAVLGQDYASPVFDYSCKTGYGTDVIIVNENGVEGCDYADIMSIYEGYLARISILTPADEMTQEDIDRGLALMTDLWVTTGTAVPDSVGDMWEINGAVLTIRIPEAWAYESNGEAFLDLLTGGETVDGFTSYSFMVPGDRLTGEEQYAQMLCVDPEGVRTLAIGVTVDTQGNLAPCTLAVTDQVYRLDWGPYGENGEYLLTVEIDGNPTTGYQWTFTPDNSGLLEAIDGNYVQDEAPEGMAGVGGTYYWIFQPTGVYAGDTTLLFNYARSWETSVYSTLCITVSLDENGMITKLDPLYLEY